MFGDIGRSEASDQNQAPGRVVGIEPVDQAQQRVGIEAGTAFQPDGIADAARKFEMSAIELPGAVADPKHMSSRRPILLARLVEPGQRLLVIEKQGFVAGEHRDRPGRLGESDFTMHLG